MTTPEPEATAAPEDLDRWFWVGAVPGLYGFGLITISSGPQLAADTFDRWLRSIGVRLGSPFAPGAFFSPDDFFWLFLGVTSAFALLTIAAWQLPLAVVRRRRALEAIAVYSPFVLVLWMYGWLTSFRGVEKPFDAGVWADRLPVPVFASVALPVLAWAARRRQYSMLPLWNASVLLLSFCAAWLVAFRLEIVANSQPYAADWPNNHPDLRLAVARCVFAAWGVSGLLAGLLWFRPGSHARWLPWFVGMTGAATTWVVGHHVGHYLQVLR